jgi:hypothetical protein
MWKVWGLSSCYHDPGRPFVSRGRRGKKKEERGGRRGRKGLTSNAIASTIALPPIIPTLTKYVKLLCSCLYSILYESGLFAFHRLGRTRSEL